MKIGENLLEATNVSYAFLLLVEQLIANVFPSSLSNTLRKLHSHAIQWPRCRDKQEYPGPISEEGENVLLRRTVLNPYDDVR